MRSGSCVRLRKGSVAQHLIQAHLCPFARRRAEEALWVAFLNDLTRIHKDDPVSDLEVRDVDCAKSRERNI